MNNENARHILDSVQNLQANSFNQMGRSNVPLQSNQNGMNVSVETSLIRGNEMIREDVMEMVAEQIDINEMFLKFVH